ncbi:NERD domain-containing protein [Rhizobium leguminosarum]|uniref:NERD domain-containing protein n=1 Tax=Rhizobium leguminosarum TaxID=384 RepID=UPI0028AF9D9E|nr:ATP-binding domain-containing protein [Rhizobium leguminosarum]
MSIVIYGEKASRTHENQMLQAFLEQLEDRWATSDDWIFVVANTLWNGTEIDLVCILPSAILVADFKGHCGKLTGTENGPWQADGVLVKGGNKANPYHQLRDNKFSVLDWLKSRSLLSGRNLGHISAGVIFSGHIVDQLELPPKVRAWLYPTNIDSCVTLLDALASPELRIDRKEAQNIVQRLGVRPITWKSTRPAIRPVEPRPVQPRDHAPLTLHQQDALQALRRFVSSDDPVTFSVLGMTSTGKSRLLAEVCSEIEKVGKKPIVLSPNRRLAKHPNAESIYSHLYSGGKAEDEEEGSAEEKARLAVIPLGLCEDDANCVYLLDDAHLLGNSRFTTPDGKQYGSGYLLDDFLAFTELGKTKRKAIYFGDPYQIQRSGDDESALLGEFQKRRELKHQSLELNQVIDMTSGSAKLANAERLVRAIRSKQFAELELLKDEGFRQVEKQEAAAEMLERYRSDPLSIWYLAETHTKTNAFTQWVRERLHDEKPLASLEVGELLEIYVVPKSERFVPATDDFLIYAGHRRRTASVGTKEYYAQSLRGRSATVLFHSVHCTLEGIGQPSLEILEEFLISEKPELTADIAIAERVRRKSNEQPPLPPFAYVRFGYASTVHHAQGMSQPICYVNGDHAAGRHSEGYFRWLYSALTVAERELVLFNFTDIHPFDSAVWKGVVIVATDIPVGAGWSFEPKGIASEKDQQRDLPGGLDQSKDVLKSAAIWLRIANAVERLGWRVVNAACHPYQEQYDLIGPNGERCKLRIPYNEKNVVTAIHVNDSAFWPLLADVASRCLEANSYTPEAEGLLRSAHSRLSGKGWKVVSAIETAYRLTVTVGRSHDERIVVEVNFDKQGLASSLRPLQTSDPELLVEVQGALL